ncbi:uncharacterized protein Z519_09565 [Cladophialophora bantiana CBS 173.52]|uniref:2,4-dienoyl-CoA reductase [(3E)-enoyl-CoA-producing] n=1 Tax=Cladophialophora bantiana (strain ATCC 10958 / CBS 173.52 / CDC B-1940 / NIH 8579) TaxID=1442370 RepID=A0A0D2HA71_CLAB1|nr:uncharacterized protein Z519_09565 [Cladophialophora bantiana CBS 173.52]KIW90133.1 hypothetical protein Z519_09565 [Cladophialophora bantiana CBS 173.52]
MAPSVGQFASTSWKPGLFDNKVLFCTGGSGSICSGQVRALVALGANACIVGRNHDKAKNVAADIALVRPGSTVLGLGGVDVRNHESVKEAVDTCVQRLGGIDFVMWVVAISLHPSNHLCVALDTSWLAAPTKYNTPWYRAGAAGNFVSTIDDLSVNAFKAVVDIDLVGSFITAKLTLPHLAASAERARTNKDLDSSSLTGGRIIFVSSTNYQCARIAQAHVCAAKAGVNALSDCISLEYGPRGVTSNVIAPGLIDDTEGARRLTDPTLRNDLIRSVPVQRLGLIKDISDATIFLFADTGSFVNGATIDVDGGAWRIRAAGAGPNYPSLPSRAHQVKLGGSSKL